LMSCVPYSRPQTSLPRWAESVAATAGVAHSLGLRCARVAAKKALEQREAERPDIRRQTVRVAVQPKIAAARANQRTC
jgi:hypothetical protein